MATHASELHDLMNNAVPQETLPRQLVVIGCLVATWDVIETGGDCIMVKKTAQYYSFVVAFVEVLSVTFLDSQYSVIVGVWATRNQTVLHVL